MYAHSTDVMKEAFARSVTKVDGLESDDCLSSLPSSGRVLVYDRPCKGAKVSMLIIAACYCEPDP